MPNCPNCGLPTKRTEDWACQLCGHPLLSKSFKQIPKTYKQVQEERLRKQDSPLKAERPHEQKSYLRNDTATTTIDLTVEELLAVCTLDKDEAATRFKDRILMVTGVVSRIVVKYDYDIYYVRLTSSQKREECNVNCMFDKENSPELSQLTEGQTVTIKGKYDDYELNILVKDCVLVRSPVGEETQVALQPSNILVPSTHTRESEREPMPEPETKPEPAPETMLESKPQSMAEPEPELTPEPETEPILEPEPKAIPELEAEPEGIQEPEPESMSELEPVSEVERELQPQPEQTTSALEVTVEELLSAYKEDGAAADARFMNKILKVTGLVNRIELEDYLDFSYITLTGTEKSLLQNVRCIFDKKYGPELSQLTTGQRVTVQGKYDGSMINMRLRGCVLIS